MIRFIDLGNQITADEGDKDFAWYDTITDRFLMYNGAQTWDCWEDFESDYLATLAPEYHPSGGLDRFARLYPLVRQYKAKEKSNG